MTPRRVPGPAGVDTDLRAIKAYVPTWMWAEVFDRAEKAGLSVSGYMRALVQRDTLDEHGRPTWASQVEQQEMRLSA